MPIIENKKKLIRKEEEFINYALNNLFDPLLLLNNNNLKIRNLTAEEKESKNITYIGIRLRLKKIDFAFWNNKNELSNNNDNNFDDITSKNVKYNKSELISNSLPYEIIEKYFKDNIRSNADIRIIIELPFFKDNQDDEKSAILAILKSLKNLLDKISINNEIKIINADVWKSYYANLEFDKHPETFLMLNKANLIWIDSWNPFFLDQKNLRRRFKNVVNTTEDEIQFLLSNTYKDCIKEETRNITYIGIDLGLGTTGVAFWNNINKKINCNKDKFDDINSTFFKYKLEELRPDFEPYEKIKNYFKENIFQDSIVRVIIESPYFKKNQNKEKAALAFIIETFRILLNEININNEIKFINAHTWRAYYIEYDSIFDDYNLDHISLNKNYRIKNVSKNKTGVENDDEAEAISIVNKAEEIWKESS